MEGARDEDDRGMVMERSCKSLGKKNRRYSQSIMTVQIKISCHILIGQGYHVSIATMA